MIAPRPCNRCIRLFGNRFPAHGDGDEARRPTHRSGTYWPAVPLVPVAAPVPDAPAPPPGPTPVPTPVPAAPTVVSPPAPGDALPLPPALLAPAPPLLPAPPLPLAPSLPAPPPLPWLSQADRVNATAVRIGIKSFCMLMFGLLLGTGSGGSREPPLVLVTSMPPATPIVGISPLPRVGNPVSF